jgi:uncharacterized protein (TIGR02646 family)
MSALARFHRTVPAPQVRGGYRAFWPYVRLDFRQCCAHCCLHERFAGGEENFELDHFCPKWKCPDLVEDFYNIYYSCHACNSSRKKWKHWPSASLAAESIGFVNLCKDDFDQHYELLPTGELLPRSASAQYTIDSIRLNSEHLVRIRALLLNEGKAMDKEPE